MDIASLALTPSAEGKVDRRNVASLPPGVLEQRFGKEGVDELDALVQQAAAKNPAASIRKRSGRGRPKERPFSGGPFMEPERYPDVLVSSPEHTAQVLGMGGRDSPDKGNFVPVDPHEEPVQLGGNLQKMGKIFKNWTQRYFEIQGRHMYYYKDSTKRNCLGEINLDIAFHCGPCTAATFGNPFEVRTLRRTHTLAARTYEEMSLWVSMIEANMGLSAAEARKKQGKPGKVASKPPKRSHSTAHTYTVQTSQESELSTRSLGGNRIPAPRRRGFFAKLKGKVRSRSPTSPSTTPDILSLQSGDQELEVPTGDKRPTSAPSDTPRRTSPSGVSDTPHRTSPSGVSDTPAETSLSVPADTSPAKRQTAAVVSFLEPAQVTPKGNTSDECSPEVEIPVKPVTPELLRKRFVFEEIRDLLDSLPDMQEENCYDELPPVEEVWLEETSAVDQLRVFLTVCP